MINEASYEYLQTQLRNLGFGDDIAKPLREKMEEGKDEFTLTHQRNFGKDEMHSVLSFSKGDDKEKDLTFFNRFEATLKQAGKEDLTQTFFIGQEQKFNYTLQERYNMMDGRAAFREQPRMKEEEVGGKMKLVPTGETYFAWRGLDFKASDGYGNFNSKIMFWNQEKELLKMPIKNIEENYDRSRLMATLNKGNIVPVTLLREGEEIKAKVVANPRMMRLDFYDTDGQKLTVRPVEKQDVAQTQKTEMTPQEVQRNAIARAAENKQQNVQTNGNEQNQNQQQGAKQQVAEEQKQEQGQRRRQGVRV
jgi:hypothetical protein